MDLTRFVWFLFVIVLAVGAVTPSPVCNCKTAHNLNLSEQSCLLNHLLHIISHLVSCGGQKPLDVTPEKYQQLLKVTNCKEPPETKTTTERTTTEATTPKKEESTTIPSLKWLTPTEPITTSESPEPTTSPPSSESTQEDSSESTSGEFDPSSFFNGGSNVPYIPLLTTTMTYSSEETETPETGETSSEIDFTFTSRVTETSSTTSPSEDIPLTLFPSSTSPPPPQTTLTTEKPKEPETIFTNPPLTFPPLFEPTTTPPPKKEESCDKQGLNFHAETFFIPVLKFHGGPCMSAQELRDYLFKCIPGDNKMKSS